jgi:hypothetical protein
MMLGNVTITAERLNKNPLIRDILEHTEKKIKYLTGVEVSITASPTTEVEPIDEQIKALIEEACIVWGVKSTMIKQKTNYQHIVTMRKLVALLLRNNFPKSKLNTSEIAEYVGYDSGPSAVSHALKSCTNLLCVNDLVTLKYYEPIKHLFTHEIKIK